MTVAVLIVAAGRGTRLGGEVPKQYLPIGGVACLRRTIEAFLLDGIGAVRAVIHPDDAGLYAKVIEGLDDPRLLVPVTGAESRSGSVRLGLESLVEDAPELVLIHDAARPFVPAEVIGRVIGALDGVDGACAALPQVDALWRTEDGLAIAPVPRDGLWRAQTPQGFRFDKILEAHRRFQGDAADDVAVAVAAGLRVRMVQGSARNYKITTAEDLAQAEQDAAG